MAVITIQQYTPNPPIQVDAGSTLEVRGWYSRDFVAADGVTPVLGNATSGEQGPYYSITATNPVGNLVVAAHDVQPTTESNPTGRYFEGLWVDGAFSQLLIPNTNGATGWQIPTVYGSTIAYDEIAIYNAAQTLVYPPTTYFTADQTIQEIERLAGNFSYMAVGVNGIGRASIAPVVASEPIVLMENDPRVGSWFNAVTYGLATSNTAAQNAAAINAAIAAATGLGGVFIPVGTYACNIVNFTVPVWFAPGNSILQPPTGQTISFQHGVIADRSKHFDNALTGQGLIVLGGQDWVYPEWWGGAPVDSMGAFQAAVNSGVPVSLTDTHYQLDNSTTPLLLNNASLANTVTICGAGQNVTLLTFTSTAHPGIQIDFPFAGAPSVYLSDFYMRGAAGGPPPSTIAGNYGIYVPGYHNGVAHVVSNVVLSNLQIDQFGDNAVQILGPTGPVSIENAIINDCAGYAIFGGVDGNTPPDCPQNLTIKGGSMQGSNHGGIAFIGGATNQGLSITIKDVDVELGAAQTKPCLYLEQCHAPTIINCTFAGSNGSLADFGDAIVELGPGAEYGTFIGGINNATGGLNNVHALAGATGNVFIGGQFNNVNPGGNLYVRDSGASVNFFINPMKTNFQTGKDALNEVSWEGTLLHLYGGSGTNRQLILGEGVTGTQRSMYMGYDFDNDYAGIQSIHQGVSFTPIALQEGGGAVGVGIKPTLANGLHVDKFLAQGEGATLTISSNAITLTNNVHHINNAGGLIKTINVPTGFVGGTIYLIAGTTPFTTDTSGNISRSVSTLATGQMLALTWTSSSSKWNPAI
jgi:hypothetical protein